LIVSLGAYPKSWKKEWKITLEARL